MFICQYSEEN